MGGQGGKEEENTQKDEILTVMQPLVDHLFHILQQHLCRRVFGEEFWGLDI